jgi:hypothetical protein
MENHSPDQQQVAPEPERVVSPPAATQTRATIALVLLIVIIAIQGWNILRPEPRWEYKIETISDAIFPTQVNSLGSDGWELVFARRATTGPTESEKPIFAYEMIFKRKARH